MTAPPPAPPPSYSYLQPGGEGGAAGTDGYAIKGNNTIIFNFGTITGSTQ